MEIEELLNDAFAYAKEALVGKWVRWAIFIILALPFSLVQFVFDPKKISDGAKMNWDAVPWGQIAVLFGIGLLLSFFLSGYMVRIYRGIKPAPDFTGSRSYSSFLLLQPPLRILPFCSSFFSLFSLSWSSLSLLCSLGFWVQSGFPAQEAFEKGFGFLRFSRPSEPWDGYHISSSLSCSLLSRLSMP
jgi:hypothetical protein